MIILGAGLAGCIAAHLFPGSRVLEYQSEQELTGAHRALLRFRSEEISRITGIPFRKVLVQKEVAGGNSILAQNNYSRKVAGALAARSIVSVESAYRWVAPVGFHAQMLAQLEGRVEFSQKIARISQTGLWHSLPNCDRGLAKGIDRTDEAVLSTIPLPIMLGLAELNQDYAAINFRRSPIFVRRGTLREADVYQTIYFPSPHMGLYRASITGDLLIIESVNKPVDAEELEHVYRAFGIWPNDVLLESTPSMQQFGKIVPLSDVERHAILLRLTQACGVYSLGRFATWRNLLLDDLPQDAARIRELIRMTDYESRIHSAKLLE